MWYPIKCLPQPFDLATIIVPILQDIENKDQKDIIPINAQTRKQYDWSETLEGFNIT